MTDETKALMKAAVLEAVPDFTDEQAERVVERVLNVYIPPSWRPILGSWPTPPASGRSQRRTHHDRRP